MAVFAEPGATTPFDFTEAVLDVVAQIPAGRVMTYGDVAWVFGRPGARAVGTVMARYGADAPWWRAVRAGGRPPTGHEEAALTHYVDEATPLIRLDGGYRIDLPRAIWSPHE